MSAGTGVIHSEYNPSGTAPLHLLQIWIMPNARGHTPRYDQRTFPARARTNTLLRVVSSDGANGGLAIHQDAALYVSDLHAGARLAHALAPGRRAYVFVTAGSPEVNGQRLGPSDAAAVEGEARIELASAAPSGPVLLDLP